MFIDDVVEVLVKDEPHYEDNDMLRASVKTQAETTSTKTLREIIDIVVQELSKRKWYALRNNTYPRNRNPERDS